jgi:hypothetical protein
MNELILNGSFRRRVAKILRRTCELMSENKKALATNKQFALTLMVKKHKNRCGFLGVTPQEAIFKDELPQVDCPPLDAGSCFDCRFYRGLADFHGREFSPRRTRAQGRRRRGHPLSVEAGVRIRQHAGNAVDAGVATILAASVIEHFSLGGEVPILIKLRTKDVAVIEGMGAAPTKATSEFFLQRSKMTGVPAYRTVIEYDVKSGVISESPSRGNDVTPSPVESSTLPKYLRDEPMAEPKTKQTRQDVQKYLNAIPDAEKREDCITVAKLMKEATDAEPKMWGSSIVGFGVKHYKYASGREGDWPLIAFSPRKQNVTLYIAIGHSDPALLKKLGKHKVGGGCLYIRRLADVDLSTLKKLIKSAAKRKA